MKNFLFAHDVFNKWRIMVKRAISTIVIFTPYMDRTLENLLSNRRLVKKRNIEIITDFNPETILDQPYHLFTVKRLLERGYIVKKLDGLHAKILVTDQKYISVGSQNFTSRGRKNKECTAIPNSLLDISDCLSILEEWQNKSQSIDIHLISMLINKLKKHQNQYKRLVEEATIEVEAAIELRKVQQKIKKLNQLEFLREKSRYKLVDGKLICRIKWFRDNNYDEYRSLTSYPGQYLNKWLKIGENGQKESYEIYTPYMYPALNADTGQMVFARITRTRISYVRTTVSFQKFYYIQGTRFSVEISFPNDSLDYRNIIVELKSYLVGTYLISFLFDGNSIELIEFSHNIEKATNKDLANKHRITLQTEFSGSDSSIKELLNKHFDSFKYKRLDLENKNLEFFLRGSIFEVSLIEFAERPVFIIKKS